MSSVATVGVRILLQDSASAGLAALGGQVSRLGYQFGQLGSTWSGLDTVQKAALVTTGLAGAAFAGFAGALGYAVTQGENIQNTLANVSIAVQGADKHSKELQDTIIGLADNSIFSVSQVGDAFVALGEHGMDAATILKDDVGLVVVNLAEALGTQTVPAANLLSVTLQQFGIDAIYATGVANDLTAAFYNGIPSVSQLQDAIVSTAPQAKFLGVGIQDLTIMLDILAQHMGNGAEAGTALRNMLKDLTDPTNNAIKGLSQLGVVVVNDTPDLQRFRDEVAASGKAGRTAADDYDGSTGSLLKLFQAAQKVGLVPLDQNFYEWGAKNQFLNDKLFDSTGKFLGLKNAIDQLNLGLQGLPPQQQAAILTQIFNVKGSKGLETLAGDVQSFNTAWGNLQTVFGQTNTQADAAKKTSTLSGALKEFGTTLKDAFGLTGMQIIPMITAFVQHLNKMVDHFNHMGDSVKLGAGHFLLFGTIISGIISSGGGILFLLESIAKHFVGVKAASGPMGALGYIFEMLLGKVGKLPGPLSLIPKLIHGVTAGGGDAFEGLIRTLDKVGKGLLGLGGLPIGVVHQGLNGLIGVITGTISPSKLLSGSFSLLSGSFSGWGTILKMLIPGVFTFAGSLLAVAGPILLIIGVIAIIILLFTQFRQQGQQVVSILRGIFLPVWNDIKQTVTQVIGMVLEKWKEVKPQVEVAINHIVGAIRTATPFFQFLGFLIGNLVSWITHLLGGIITGFLQALPYIIGFVSSVLSVLGNLFGMVNALIHGNWGAAWKYFLALPASAWGLVKNLFGAIIAFIWGFISGIIGFFKHLFESIVGHSIWTDMLHMMVATLQIFVGVAHAIINFFVNGAIAIFNILKAGVQLIVTALVAIWQIFWAYLQLLFAIIRAVFIMPLIMIFALIWAAIHAGIALVTGRWDDFKQALMDFYNTVNNNVIQPVVKAFQSIWDAIQNGVKNAMQSWDDLKNKLLDFYNNTIGKLKDLWDTITKIFNANPSGGDNKKSSGTPGSHASGAIVSQPELAWIAEGGETEIVAPVSKLIAAAQMAFLNSGGFGGGGDRPTNVNIYLDGKLIYQAQVDRQTSILRANGFGRKFR